MAAGTTPREHSSLDLVAAAGSGPVTRSRGAAAAVTTELEKLPGMGSALDYLDWSTPQ